MIRPADRVLITLFARNARLYKLLLINNLRRKKEVIRLIFDNALIRVGYQWRYLFHKGKVTAVITSALRNAGDRISRRLVGAVHVSNLALRAQFQRSPLVHGSAISLCINQTEKEPIESIVHYMLGLRVQQELLPKTSLGIANGKVLTLLWRPRSHWHFQEA
jgi:hypothetical protein